MRACVCTSERENLSLKAKGHRDVNLPLTFCERQTDRQTETEVEAETQKETETESWRGGGRKFGRRVGT